MIMDHGQLINQGAPKALVRELNKHQNISLKFKNGDFTTEVLDNTVGVTGHQRQSDSIIVNSSQSVETIKSLFDYASDNSIEITELDVKLPNLEDVFLSQTGAQLRDE
jgi:ABC-2 type transport system ATP-binding protein